MSSEYPRWFKGKASDIVIKFYDLKCGVVVEKGASNFEVGFYASDWASCTDIGWEEVTHLYKDQTPKCKHNTPLDSECEDRQEASSSEKPNTSNKYKRKVPTLEIDVYDILKAFKVINPATQHAIKKLLCAGDRGYKDKVQDLKEALVSISRAIELESDNE